MHINKILSEFLHDKNEYVVWFNNQVYVYGVQDIKILNSQKIVLMLDQKDISIFGNNLRIIKSNEIELLGEGDIHEIKK